MSELRNRSATATTEQNATEAHAIAELPEEEVSAMKYLQRY